MNCNEFRLIIDQGQPDSTMATMLQQHMADCPQCSLYYKMVFETIEKADQLLISEEPSTDLAASIGDFVFNAVPEVRVVPMWVKITTAAAAVVFGLLIGSAVYQSRTVNSTTNNDLFVAEAPADTIYMAETTEIMYLSFMSENE